MNDNGFDYFDRPVKGLLPRIPFVTPVAGVKAMGTNLKGFRPGAWLNLRAEPDNPHDGNAVIVETLDGSVLGYLPRHIAARLKAKDWAAHIDQVLSYDGEPAGLRLKLTPLKKEVATAFVEAAKRSEFEYDLSCPICQRAWECLGSLPSGEIARHDVEMGALRDLQEHPDHEELGGPH